MIIGDGSVLKPGYVCYNKESGDIISVSDQAPTEQMETMKCELLTPGFVDIHLHGIGGSNDLMEFWQTPEYTLSRLTKFGTTSVMATMIVPGEQTGYDKCMKACKAVNKVMN